MAKPIMSIVISPMDVDLAAFSLWLKGMDVQNATSFRMANEPPITRKFPDYASLLLAETQDMYQLFNSMETYIQSPPTFMNQQVFQVSKSTEGAGKVNQISIHYRYLQMSDVK